MLSTAMDIHTSGSADLNAKEVCCGGYVDITIITVVPVANANKQGNSGNNVPLARQYLRTS